MRALRPRKTSQLSKVADDVVPLVASSRVLDAAAAPAEFFLVVPGSRRRDVFVRSSGAPINHRSLRLRASNDDVSAETGGERIAVAVHAMTSAPPFRARHRRVSLASTIPVYVRDRPGRADAGTDRARAKTRLLRRTARRKRCADGGLPFSFGSFALLPYRGTAPVRAATRAESMIRR